MGCDIHMFAEVRSAKTGKWKFQKKAFKYVNWNGETVKTDSPYQGQNYALFAILADVRNYDGFVPIDKPRGIPFTASKRYHKMVEKWDGDGHGASWFTVKELLDFDWDRMVARRGIVTKEEFRRIGGKGVPKDWCRDVIGRGTSVAISPADKRLIVLGHDDTRNHSLVPHNYVEHTWEETYRDSVGDFLTETVPKLQELGDPWDVRIVFFFDS